MVGARLNADFTFASFVEGKSNQLARAAAHQVAENPGRAYNPLFIYGGVGLGKTHLMHAIAHLIKERDPEARIAYVHSERFVGDMVRALQHNTMNEFKTRTARSMRCSSMTSSSSPARSARRRSSSTPSTNCSRASTR